MHRIVVLLVGLLVILGGGLPGGPAVPDAAAQGPAGVLRISIIGDVTLNPFTQPQQLPTSQVLKVAFSGLTRYRPGDLEPVPDLATAWRPLEDGKVWEFTLRKGVRWHDGKPLTAADVKFTLENIVNPKVNALFRSQLKPLQRVDIVDEATGPHAPAFGPYFNASLKPYPYDVARAKELLAQAGFKPGPDGVLQKEGKRLAFELMVDKGNLVREQIALFTQQSWKQLGADVRLNVEEWSVYIKKGNSCPPATPTPAPRGGSPRPIRTRRRNTRRAGSTTTTPIPTKR